MTDDLLAGLLQRAEQSSPAVRAAALMRIARLESAAGAGRARQIFERGLEEARRLSGFDREWLLEQARLLAAAVAPDLVLRIPLSGSGRSHDHINSEFICRTMLEHNHVDAARATT